MQKPKEMGRMGTSCNWHTVGSGSIQFISKMIELTVKLLDFSFLPLDSLKTHTDCTSL